MKRLICLLLVLMLLLVGCKNDAAKDAAVQNGEQEIAVYNPEDYTVTGTCGENLQWGLNEQTGELGIGGEGIMYDYSMDLDSAPWSEYTYTSVRVCDGVTSIGTEAFRGNESLTSVQISGTVTSIGAAAFYSCTNLTNVSISSAVTEIGQNAFTLCSSLSEISVSGDNANYKSVDGVLFTKDGKTLVQYPVGKGADSYKIPDGVETIGELAFANCGDTLTTLEIPTSVTSIGKSAFVICRVLTTVNYAGTESQWKAIKIAEENDLLRMADIQFS